MRTTLEALKSERNFDITSLNIHRLGMRQLTH
jgi:hypothetical protein